MSIHELIERADCAALATVRQRIVAANPAFSTLLGHPRDALVGQTCFQVLQGRDALGNRHCSTSCVAGTPADENESICHFRMDLRRSSGDYVPVGLTTMLLRTQEWPEPATLHLIHPIAPGFENPEVDGIRTTKAPQNGAAHERRQRLDRQVLEILSHGQDLQAIAEGMRISICSARGSLYRLLDDLDEKTRREALDFAHREGLL